MRVFERLLKISVGSYHVIQIDNSFSVNVSLTFPLDPFRPSRSREDGPRTKADIGLSVRQRGSKVREPQQLQHPEQTETP